MDIKELVKEVVNSEEFKAELVKLHCTVEPMSFDSEINYVKYISQLSKEGIVTRIIYFRKQAKLTQKALSLALGMNPSYINRLESKRDFLPSLEVLFSIFDLCNTTPLEFFYYDVNNYSDDMKLISSFRSAPKTVKLNVLKLLGLL